MFAFVSATSHHLPNSMYNSKALTTFRYFATTCVAFMVMHSPIAHAQTAERLLAESFFERFASGLKRDGYCSKSPQCTWTHLDGHEEIDLGALRARGLVPEDISINYFGTFSRWITTKSSSASVEIVVAAESSFISSAAPDAVVATRYRIPIAKNAKTGTIKIVPPINKDGNSAWSPLDVIKKREYVALGVEEKLTSLYSNQQQAQRGRADDSNRGGDRQLCEAQKQTCLANCGNPSYWNGSRYVENQSWSSCNSRCNAITCN